jgi:uncharacterized membrane protein
MFNYAPYGPAPWFCFPLMEISVYMLFLLCFLHARRKGKQYVGYLFGGLVFGLILEYVNVNCNIGYSYGEYLVMLGRAPHQIPLCVGVGWGIIIFSSRILSDELKLPLWTAVAVDCLLAISIDISMDTVAYRLHMWNWHWGNQNPLTSDWFGVPYDNFFGWLMVVFFYSSFSRLLEGVFSKVQRFSGLLIRLTPVFAILLSEAALYVVLVYVDRFLDNHGIHSITRFLCLFSNLALVVFLAWRKRGYPTTWSSDTTPPALTWLVPAWFHLYFFIWLFSEGFFLESKRMTCIAIANLLLALFVHIQKVPYFSRWTRKTPSPY